MIALLLAAGGFGYYALCTIFILICILLIFMVVITPSSEGGMAAAFGGMGSDSFFGTKAHQSINKFTVFLAVSFLLLAFWINWSNKGGTTAAGDGGTKARSATEEKIKNLPTTPKTPEAPPAPPK
jgi:protein translocase SecG subunit